MSEQSPGFEIRPEKKPLFDNLKRFVDNSYFKVDDQRANEFLYRDRSSTKFYADLLIPIGKYDNMLYKGKVTGGVSDRPISSYQIMLFPDVFQIPISYPESFYDPKIFLQEAVRLDNPSSIFGGYEQAFKPGNVVLDIASGEAVADVQLSQKFPETTIIGTDILYKQEKTISPRKPGFQLTYGDWKSLNKIPNASIDTIISCQGLTRWGLNSEESTEDKNKIIQTLNRISKSGTIMRFDDKNDFLCKNIGPDWEISEREDVFIAKKH